MATYHWSGPNGYNSTDPNPSIPISGTENVGLYQLYVQVGDCLSETNSIEILSVDAKPEAQFSFITENRCESNQNYSLINESKNYTNIFWDLGSEAKSLSDQPNDGKVVTFNTAGLKKITLTVQTKNGCTSTISREILVELKPEKPVISVNQPAFCLQDILKLSVPEGDNFSYEWSGPNNFTATTSSIEIPLISFNQAGLYQIVITLGTCKSDIASIVIPEIARIPVASFLTEPSFNVKFAAPVPINFINKSQYGDSYLWNFGEGLNSTDESPTHVYQNEGIFKITLTAYSKNGCSNTVTQGDLVIKRNSSIFTPNAFSPNGDGVNDEFVVGITNLKKYRIQIYNRLGNQVFFTDNIFDNWKGTFKDNNLPVGVYYYVIFSTDLSNKSAKYSGSVTLIR